MRIAIVSNHPAPYRDPFLARMSHCREFHVDIFNELTMDTGHSFWDLKEHGYTAKNLFPSKAKLVTRLLILIRNFVFGPYDFVLWPGFLHFEITVATLFMALLGRRYGFVADTVLQQEIHGVRKIIKNLIVNHASLIFVPGNKGASFWRDEYGVPEMKVVKGAYALDGSKLEKDIDNLRVARAEIRKRYGVESEDVVFLMVANMIPTRHYPITTEAFVRFASGRTNYKFVIVGVGPDLQRMKDFSKEHQEIVVLSGVSFQEMLSLYAMADVYVHGGCEPASTALVIGAIAKLPLVSTKSVGCYYDVLKEDISGIDARDPTDVEGFTDAFKQIDKCRDRWTEMGIAARELSKSLDVECVVGDFCAAIRNMRG